MTTTATGAKFTTTKEDYELIGKIVNRAIALNTSKGLGAKIDRISSLMDLDACHSNGTPLDFQKFLDFDDFNFLHDFFGIRNNIDRNNGTIGNCFLPRCSK